MKRSLRASCVIATLLLLAGSRASAQPYSFTKITEGVMPNVFFSAPTVNAHGMVAFAGTYSGDGGIFIGNGGPLTEIVISDPNVGASNSGASVDISSNGSVGFHGGGFPAGPGIYKIDGGTLTHLSAGTLQNFNTSPVINGNGRVAFVASGPGPGIGQYALYSTAGGARITIADTSGPLSRIMDVISINDSGVVAFVAQNDDGTSAIYTGSGGAITPIVDSVGSSLGFGSASINNSGDIAFRGFSAGGGYGAYLSRGGVITTIVDNSSPFELIGEPYINAAGGVAFVGRVGGSNSNGIYTGPDPVTDKVIVKGDSLFGSTLTSLQFNNGHGENGEIAFVYELASGHRGIAVATPVPEPAGLALLAMSVASVLVCRMRTRP